MINNRQNGRRRGRGGPQVRGGGNGPERGNRIDNRARGNAAQLHEKYRNLARDAQTQGDRVMTEYYLQFADHYFRVLSESRARFEENQPRRQAHDDLDYGDEGEGFEDRGQQPRYEQRAEPRQDQRPNGGEREQGYRPQPQRAEAADEPEAAAPAGDAEDGRRGRRVRRPRREGQDAGAAATAGERAEQPERIEVDRLPPAFVPLDNGAQPDAEDGETPPKRRRTRRASKDDGDSVAA